MGTFDASRYTITVKKVREDNEELFYASVNEIPDISSYSENYQDAYEDCLDALEVLYEEAQSQGKSFPTPFVPVVSSRPSGRVTLRMSRSLHERVARYAKQDGVSLNHWIIEAVSQRSGTYSAKPSFADTPSIKTFTTAAFAYEPLLSMATKQIENVLGSTFGRAGTPLQNNAPQESQ